MTTNTRKQIGWVHWSRTEYGKTPVYEGDFDNFDPTQEDPTDEEMEVLVEEAVEAERLDKLDLRWEAFR